MILLFVVTYSGRAGAQVLHTSPGGVELAVAAAPRGAGAVLLVQVRNAGEAPADVAVALLPPPGVHAAFLPGEPLDARGRACAPAMRPHGGAAFVAALSVAEMAPADAFRLQLETAGGADIPVHIPPAALGFHSFLRPADLVEAAFGEQWGSHPEERRLDVPAAAVRSAADFERLAPARLNLKVPPRRAPRRRAAAPRRARSRPGLRQVVKVIGVEVIGAAQHPAGGLCLVHARIGDTLSFIVRTRSAVYTHNVAGCLASLLAP
jgi:hypothetical protein